MVKRDKSNYMIQSVTHALDVLEELAKSNGEVGVTELSKKLKLHKNNVFRLLATLELRSYVEQNSESEDYRLGVKVLQLGQSYLTSSKLVERATMAVRRLSESTLETVSFAVLQNGMVQYPVSIEAKRPVRVAARVANAFPAKMCASGRLLTAQLSDNILGEILAANTPQDAAIYNQLADLRMTGQIVDKGGAEAEVLSIAHVVRGTDGEVVGALELIAPLFRAKLDELAPKVKEVANELSTALGAVKRGLVSTMEKEVVAIHSNMAASVAFAK